MPLYSLLFFLAGCGYREQLPYHREMAPFPTGQVCRVAVLPFANDSDYPLGDVMVKKIVMAELQEAGDYQVLQEGDVAKTFQQLRIYPGRMPNLEQMQIIADRLNAEILITGIILEMREDPWQYATINPKIVMEIQIRDGRNGETLWTAYHQPARHRLYEDHAFWHNSFACRFKPANGSRNYQSLVRKRTSPMHRILSTLILFAVLSLLSAAPAKAWLFGDSALVTIDGTEYTAEDFKRWWGFWKEAEMSFPETPDPYIDWLLLAREGQRMELDRDPGFERATKVFLMSRTLLKLKYEEVDSQIDVTDAEVRKRYDQDYAPRWGLEGMEFKDKAAASAAWEELKSGSVTIAEPSRARPGVRGAGQDCRDMVASQGSGKGIEMESHLCRS